MTTTADRPQHADGVGVRLVTDEPRAQGCSGSSPAGLRDHRRTGAGRSDLLVVARAGEAEPVPTNDEEGSR